MPTRRQIERMITEQQRRGKVTPKSAAAIRKLNKKMPDTEAFNPGRRKLQRQLRGY